MCWYYNSIGIGNYTFTFPYLISLFFEKKNAMLHMSNELQTLKCPSGQLCFICAWHQENHLINLILMRHSCITMYILEILFYTLCMYSKPHTCFDNLTADGIQAKKKLTCPF